jgi:hypothetical protein
MFFALAQKRLLFVKIPVIVFFLIKNNSSDASDIVQ